MRGEKRGEERGGGEGSEGRDQERTPYPGRTLARLEQGATNHLSAPARSDQKGGRHAQRPDPC